jgi:hypothetical protein
LALAIGLALLPVVSNVSAQAAGEPSSWRAEIVKTLDATAAKMRKTVSNPVVGSVGGEWAVLGLARAGKADASYKNKYLANLSDYVKSMKGVLHSQKYTEYSRVILALSSLGVDARDVAGYDLTAPLAEYEKVVFQGVNGPTFALIALDTVGYDIPTLPSGSAHTQATREKLVDTLVSKQSKDGGWNLTGSASGSADADLTGMALQALAPYYFKGEAKVTAAVDKALAKLSQMQGATGGFGSDMGGGDAVESTAQVVVALNSLGVAMDDPRFVKGGKSVFDDLMRYYVPAEAGFKHNPDGEVDEMATEQALYALVSMRRALDGKNTLYDMTDTGLDGSKPVSGDGTDVSKDPDDGTDTTKKTTETTKKKTTKTTAKKKTSNAATGTASTSTVQLDFKAGELIPEASFAKVKGKDQNVRAAGASANGLEYTIVFNGEDLGEPVDFDSGLLIGGPSNAVIAKMAPGAFAFSVSGPLPGKAMVELATGLPDAEYLLFRLGSEDLAAEVVQRVAVESGKARFFLNESGNYYLAGRSARTLAAVLSAPQPDSPWLDEAPAAASTSTSAPEVAATAPVSEATLSVPETSGGSGGFDSPFAIALMVALAGVSLGAGYLGGRLRAVKIALNANGGQA